MVMTNSDMGERLITEGCTKVRLHMGSVAYFRAEKLVARICNTCKKIKLRESFNKSKGMPGGIKPSCKECSAEYNRKYREQNKEKIAEYNRKYSSENRDKILEKGRKYREENKEQIEEYDKVYREENRERYSTWAREWSERNPWRVRMTKQRRRARENGLPDDFTDEDCGEMMKHFNNSCALSEETNDVHVDHIIPLSIGLGGTIKGNMLPLQGKLNISKSNRNIFQWFDKNRERLNLPQEKFDKAIRYLAEQSNMSLKEYEEYVYTCFKGEEESE